MKQILVSGADVSLWHVAARELGDATQAYRLARINGLADPMLSGIATLVIPETDGGQSGGLPVQDGAA